MSNKIKHVAVIGTGVIGISWVTYFLSKGLEVTASDPAPDAEERLRKGITLNNPDISLELLHFEVDPVKAVKGVQFVQENGPERLEIKQELFAKLDAATDPSVLIVSSSSGIQASEFQMSAKHPERILLGHPFNPPHLIPLVEVCGGKATSEEAVLQTIEFYKSIGKKPIRLLKEKKGHVANRLQAALWQEAFYLVKEGVASIEDIDLAISQGPGLRWALLGPFLNLHLSGGNGGIKHVLEHLGPPMESWMKDLGTIEIDQNLIELISTELSNVLKGKDLQKIIDDRNKVLLDLMDMKSKAVELP
ncbi:3-hydroxyacyl-CoA dehydrogenase NAD-binding domain-containing protein [Sphingobacterium siyangense]|uniref:3-hydroxyacyl-CoA dehydrogenase n=1 Tax=Sphingobacterium siyangense TaxID=459529 RepID=A0A562MK65_9SPHI|nr:3-hydroxyacyl-CoA dehydrogenase NAD-binding domain-containing protein [Sphingobacterium siyangense]TWI20327.1 3-hydroxyacyl-CoA dehydrogenase [Sphingobacterium siyangense]